MNEEVMSKHTTYDRHAVVMECELSMAPEPKGVLRYVRASATELDVVFQFDIAHLGQGPIRRRRVESTRDEAVRGEVAGFVGGTDGWTTVC
jgi:oligo-1,6-glucosidase